MYLNETLKAVVLASKFPVNFLEITSGGCIKLVTKEIFI